MRLFSILFSFVFLLGMTDPAAAKQSNPRYASLVMDETTGQILHQENGYAQRFPASLTKMMTLYLLFESMKQGKVSLNTQFTVSKYAASQPQTNISLRPGAKIRVEDCIKALVIRSANDVAVVVAENLGKSEWNFARLMTAKASALGMKNTIFRNPHGLPDPRQHTTAYDMVILGKALKRDFPQYYPYFNTRSFTYNGVTYATHNRVMTRYQGTDGIKTGYIRASGFNVVTSVNRHGHKLIAVVMGGITAQSRDDHMIALLNRTYAQLDTKGGTAYAQAPVVVAPASIMPTPQVKPAVLQVVTTETVEVDAPDAASPVATKTVARTVETRMVPMEKPIQTASTEGLKPLRSISSDLQPAEKVALAPAEQPVAIAPAQVTYTPVSYQQSSASLPARNTLEYQMVMLSQGSNNTESKTLSASLPANRSKDWGIQIGAFHDERQAKDAVKRAYSMAQEDLRDAYITISSQQVESKTIHRARLGNLSRDEANAVCRKLIAHQASCFAVPIQ